MIFKGYKKRKLLEATGEGVALGLLDGLKDYCYKARIDFRSEDVEYKTFEDEFLCLWAFLAIIACQTVFKEETSQQIIIDSLCNILSKNFSKNRILERSRQYYKLLDTKQSHMDTAFMLEQIQYDFVANLFNKDPNFILTDKNFRDKHGKNIILLGLEICDMFANCMRIFKDGKLKVDRYLNIDS